MSELVQNLNEIYNVKLQIKSALETSSDQFSDYPSYINALKPSGYAYVTENGDYDVKSYAYVNVDCETLPEGYSYINQGTMVSLVNGNTVFEQYGLTKLQIDATQFGYFTNYKIQEEDEAFDNQTAYSITENGDYVVNPVRDSYCFRQKISVAVPVPPGYIVPTGEALIYDPFDFKFGFDDYFGAYIALKERVDVKQYAYAAVDHVSIEQITGWQYSYTINSNGSHSVIGYSYVNVNVPSGPSISASTPSLIVSYNDGNTDIVEVLQPETSGTYTGSFLLPLPFDPNSTPSSPHFAYGYKIGIIDLNGDEFGPFFPMDDPDASPNPLDITLEDGNVQYDLSDAGYTEYFTGINKAMFLITSEIFNTINADEAANYNLYLRVYKQGPSWKWAIINIPNS